MLSRLVRSVRDWFTGDARLPEFSLDVEDEAQLQQLRRELREAKAWTGFYKSLASERRVEGERLERVVESQKNLVDALRQRVTFLEDLLAETENETEATRELDVLRAMGLAPLPPEVPAQPIAENGGGVRP